MLFAAFLVNAMVSPVAAARKDYSTGYYSVTTVSPFWFGQAKYGATWDTYQIQDAGITWRIVKNPMLNVYVQGGKSCLDAGTCSSFTLYSNSKWEVLSSTGAVLASRTSMPYSMCGWTFLYPTTGYMLGRCTAGTWQVSNSANRIRLTWQALVTVNGGGSFSWERVTRTVSLTAP